MTATEGTAAGDEPGEDSAAGLTGDESMTPAEPDEFGSSSSSLGEAQSSSSSMSEPHRLEMTMMTEVVVVVAAALVMTSSLKDKNSERCGASRADADRPIARMTPYNGGHIGPLFNQNCAVI